MNSRYRQGTELDKLGKIIKDRVIIVLDLETSGLSTKEDSIIEICAIECIFKENGEFQLGKKLHTHINPEFMISKKITEITGITNNLLKDQPTMDKVFPLLKAFLGNRVICAYNAKFDYGFLENLYKNYNEEYKPAEIIDALEVVRDAYEFKGGRGSYRLESVAKELRLNIDSSKLHGADYDVMTTIGVISRVLENYSDLGTEQGQAIVDVLSIVYWKGYRGWSRVYVNTTGGTVYYCPRSKSWYGKDVDLKLLNMDHIIAEVTRHTGFSENHLGRFKGEVYV